MQKVTRFEELRCWQKARLLVGSTYELTRSPRLRRDFALKDQKRRAALSSMTNIAEGFARRHVKEFIRFLDISQASAVEVQSLLYIVEDERLADPEMARRTRELAVGTEALVRGLIRYLRHRGESGGGGASREPFVPYARKKLTREYLSTKIEPPRQHFNT